MNKAVEKAKTALATKKVETVWDFLEARKGDIVKVLPKHITPDRLIGIMTYVIKGTPAIAQASQMSLISAVIQTVQLGLEPGNLGHCYYVPFNNTKGGVKVKEVQFILGYKGIIELVNRAGKAVILSTEIVYMNDTFAHEQGLNPVLKHIPTEKERGKVRGVYCVAKNLVANEKLFIYLTFEDIEKVRKSSKAANSQYSPWNTWYEEMAKKTAVRRMSKLLPLSVQERKAIATDETTKSVIDANMIDLPDETNWKEVDVVEAEAAPQVEEKVVEAEISPAGTAQAEPVDGEEVKVEPVFEPSSSDINATEAEVMREEIVTMLLALANNDAQQVQPLLQQYTKFGNYPGAQTMAALNGKRKEPNKRCMLEVTHSKIKNAYLEHMGA